MVGERRDIPAATQAALWTLSSGRCYAPGCPAPVIFEVRPGVFRKNAQIAHIFGVKRNAPRFKEGLTDDERDGFGNLLLLCLPHHGEVDDRKIGERNYPSELLRRWKVDHEGQNGPTLAKLGIVSEERLAELLEGAFKPPLDRLQEIADKIEATGEANAATVLELKQVVSVLRDRQVGPDVSTARMLMDAAQLLTDMRLRTSADSLIEAVQTMPRSTMDAFITAVGALPDTQDIRQLRNIADTMSAAAQMAGRLSREY